MTLSKLTNRYPGAGDAGLRLDNKDDNRVGPALDLMRAPLGDDAVATLWVREYGTGEGKSATIKLSRENLWDLHAMTGTMLREHAERT